MGTIQNSINIMVRLQGVAAARQGLQQVQASVKQVNTGLGSAGAGVNNFSAGLARMGTQIMQAGSNMQWLGRQLQFSFSIPIMAAGVAATKWALDSEKAMVRVRKVYGDLNLEKAIGADAVESELKALERAFTSLSNHFGTLREDVVNIAGEWAAAGSSGIALAKSTELTLRAMVLGEMEAEEATRAMIAVQAQYKLSIADLSKTLDNFNLIENETTTKMSDLIMGFERSASVARQFGVSSNELAAMLTALIPATGGAAAAGNGLKTMMSRLMAPTRESLEMLRLLRIDLDGAAWGSSNAAERFGIVAEAFQRVDPAARSAAAAILLSNWQINRGSELIENILNPMSQYNKSLDLLNGEIDSTAVAQAELNAVLTSSPKRIEIMWNIMRNAMADVIQPLIPLLLQVIGTVRKVVEGFSNASPVTRAAVGALLLFLAVLGPLVLYLAALQQAFGAVLFLFARFAGALLAPIAALSRLITLPFGGMAVGANAASGAILKFLKAPVNRVFDAWSAGASSWIGRLNTTVLGGMAGIQGKLVAAGPGIIKALSHPFATATTLINGTMLASGRAATAGAAHPVNAFNLMGTGMVKSLTATESILIASWNAFWGHKDNSTIAGGAKVLAAYNAIGNALLGSDVKTIQKLGGTWALWGVRWQANVAASGSRVIGTLVTIEAAAVGINARMTAAMVGSNITTVSRIGTAWQAFSAAWVANTAAAGGRVAGLHMTLMARLQATTLVGNLKNLGIWGSMLLARDKIITASIGRTVGIWTAMHALMGKISARGWAAIVAIQSGALLANMRTLTAGNLVMMFAAMNRGMVAIAAKAWAQIAIIAASGMWKKIAVIIGSGLLATWGALMKGMVFLATAAWKGIVLVAKKGGAMLLALLKSAGVAIISFLVSPWGIAILAITGILYLFRNQIATVFGRIKEWFASIPQGAAEGVSATAGIFGKFVDFLKRAFWALPTEVQNAMLAVIRVLQNAAQAVMRWLSYLNPFARHSPSLVDNVQNGMRVISSEYGALAGKIAGPIGSAYGHIERLKDLTASFAAVQLEIKYADQIAALNTHVPQAVGSFRALMSILPGMQQQLRGLEKSVKAQEAVVKQWEMRLNAATKAVEAQEKVISRLKEEADSYSKVIQAAQGRISDLSSAPLVGMRAMEDQIQANTLAQNKLRLEMLKIKKVEGEYKSVEDRLSSINGELENARARRLELQMGGAGSEILSFYDEQIASLEAAKRATATAQDPVDEMSATLAALEHEAEILNLEKAINFDPLTYEIEKLAKAEKELSFEQITSGIQAAQAEVARYQPMLDGVNSRIEEQERVLSGLEAQKQVIQDQYDAENDKLQQVKGSYDELANSIRDVEDALSSIGSVGTDIQGAEEKAAQAREAAARAGGSGRAGAGGSGGAGSDRALSRAEQLWDMSQGGSFDIPGGTGMVGREGGLFDQSADIDKYAADMALETSRLLGDMDMFGPLRKKWDEFSKWLQEHIQPAFGPIKDGLSTLFSGITLDSIAGEGTAIGGFFSSIQTGWENLRPHLEMAGRMIARLFGDDLQNLWRELKAGFTELWENLQPGLKALKDALPGLGIVIGIVVGLLVTAAKLLLNLVINSLRPVLAFIGDLISAVFEVVGAVFMIIEGIFTLDFGKVLQGLGQIFGALWKVIKSLFMNLVAVVAGVFGAVFDLIIGVINAIFGTAIEDVGVLVNRVVEWFMKLPGLVGSALKWLWDTVIGFFKWIYDEVVGHSIIPDMVIDVIAWFWRLPAMALEALVALGKFVLDSLIELGQNFVNFITNTVGAWLDFWARVSNLVLAFADRILTAIEKWFGSMDGTWKGFVTAVANLWISFWTAVQSIATDFVKYIWNWLADRFKALINNWSDLITTVSRAWDAFWANLRDIGTRFMNWISTGIENGLNGIRGFFERAVTFITDKWNGLRSAVSEPVRFIIDTIINKGIIKGWNDLLDTLRLPNSGLTKRLSDIRVPGFERGGKIPGSATGPRDNMLVMDRYGRTRATIRAGEGIVREPSMRKLARNSPGAFDYINRHGSLPNTPAFFLGGTMPTNGPVTNPHRLPYYNTGARWAGDFARPMGSPVNAWNAGIVAYTRRLGYSYGHHIMLNHANGVSSLYAHLSQILVSAGERVAAGQLIGRVGSTGNSTGPHLHFELRGGNAPISGDTGDGSDGGFFSRVMERITELVSAPVKRLIEQVPGAGIVTDTVKGAATSLLDRALERIREIIPFGDDESMSGQAGLVGESLANALMEAGKQLGASRRAMKIALMTAYAESTMGTDRSAMYNINRDGDIGIFQNRTTRGDGTPEQLRDPLYALRLFLYGKRVPAGYHVPGLYNIRGWEGMDLGAAAQRVQVSAYPNRYNLFQRQAEEHLTRFGYAKGTNGARSGWHLVGEAGAELVNFGGGEKVVRSAETMNLLSTQIEATVDVLKQLAVGASMLALVNAATGREAALAARSIATARDAGRRADRRADGGRADTVRRSDNSSGGVHINKAEFIFPNVENGNDAEAFMRNLEDILRRKGN